MVTQALMEYAINEVTLKNDDSLGIQIDLIDDERNRTKTKLLTVNKYEMGPHIVSERFGEKGGRVSVTVRGTGKAMLQMSQDLNTEMPPASPVTAYQLELSVSNRRKQSILKSCQTWLCPYQTGYSGPSLLSITLPSGYIVTKDMLNMADAEGVEKISFINNTVNFHYISVSISFHIIYIRRLINSWFKYLQVHFVFSLNLSFIGTKGTTFVMLYQQLY